MNHFVCNSSDLDRGRAPAVPTRSMLFVCAGNICRSPAARCVMDCEIARRGLRDFVMVDSAGTLDDRVGEKADLRMRWAAFVRGYRIRGRSRMVNRRDLERFDLVIAMDRHILQDLKRLHSRPTCRLQLLSDYLPPGSPADIPDPVNHSLRTFRKVLRMIETACPLILDDLIGQSASMRGQLLASAS